MEYERTNAYEWKTQDEIEREQAWQKLQSAEAEAAKKQEQQRQAQHQQNQQSQALPKAAQQQCNTVAARQQQQAGSGFPPLGNTQNRGGQPPAPRHAQPMVNYAVAAGGKPGNAQHARGPQQAQARANPQRPVQAVPGNKLPSQQVKPPPGRIKPPQQLQSPPAQVQPPPGVSKPSQQPRPTAQQANAPPAFVVAQHTLAPHAQAINIRAQGQSALGRSAQSTPPFAMQHAPVHRVQIPQYGPRGADGPHAKFPRVRPENDNFNKNRERQIKEDREKLKQIQRQAAAEDDIGHRGIFLLGDQAAAKPDDIVVSLKQLAEHRNCNVRHYRQSPTIEVVASELQTVQVVLSRARGMVMNTSNSQNDIDMVLIESPADGLSLEGTSIRMANAWDKDARPKAAGLERPKNMAKSYPILLPASRANRNVDEEQQRLLRNTMAMQVAITMALDRLVSYKGFVTMRLNFGALVFNKFQWKQGEITQKTATFMGNLKHPQTTARLYKLNPASLLFDRLTSARQLLAPYKSGKVSKTPPSWVGLYIWMKGDKADRIYEVKTAPVNLADNSPPVVLKRGWITPNAPGTHCALSLPMTQLNCGIACALQIHTETEFVQPAETPTGLTAQNLSLILSKDYGVSASRGELMFDWRASDCEDFRQRTSWKYRIKGNDDFIVELIRYDSYSKDRILLDRKPTETRWDMSVYHEGWDEKFVANISLKPGERAHWQPNVESFFPSTRPDTEDQFGVPQGFGAIMAWLRELLDILNAEERRAVWAD